MPTPEADQSERNSHSPEPTGAELVVVFRSRRRPEATERSLMLGAVGIPHAVHARGGEWAIVVPAVHAAGAIDQLEQYADENRGWSRQRVSPPLHPLGFVGVMTALVVLLLVAAAEGRGMFGLEWFAAGRLDSALVRQGEWWRTLTALTLHLDLEHLLGNVIFGSMFGLIAGRLLGDGLAWFSILISGAVGNGVNALVQPPPHSAVGASTAVFAALGLFAAYVWRRREEQPGRWALRWAPIVAAVVLLAWLGSGDGRTDIVAHLTGFLAGIGLGACYGSLAPGRTLGPRGQWAFGLAAVATIAVAWGIALGSHG